MTVFVIFFVLLVSVMVITIVISNNVMRKRDIDQMKNLVSGKAIGQTQTATALMKADTPLNREKIAKMVLGQDLNEKVRDCIEQAGLAWDPARTIYMALILAVIGFNIFWYLVPRGEPISILGVIIGAGAPFFYIFQKRKARLGKFEGQFPDALEFVARAMRSGHAFSVSLEMLHREFQAPLGQEFRRTFEEQNLGLPLDVDNQTCARDARRFNKLPIFSARCSKARPCHRGIRLKKSTKYNLPFLRTSFVFL